MKTVLIFFVSVFLILCKSTFCQKYIGALSKTEFNLSAYRMNFFVHMFETINQFTDFMDIKKGTVI